MKKIPLLLLCALLLFACDNSDSGIEEPVYYTIESVNYSIEEGDGIVNEQITLYADTFLNETDTYKDFIVPETFSTSSEYIFIPDENISYELSSYYNYYTFSVALPDTIENGEVKLSSDFVSYEENIPFYDEHPKSEGQSTYGIGPNTKLEVVLIQDVERLTVTYHLNLLSTNGEPLTVKGKLKQVRHLTFHSKATAAPLD